MADLRRAEKLASAKKKLRQFQQKNRDSQSESGRSTPSKKKGDEEDSFGKLLRNENGGSSNSLSQSENFSSNISGTESPVPPYENNLDVSQMINGNSQPDILCNNNVFNTLPKVSENFFKSPSPQSLFSNTPPPPSSESALAFFDSLPSTNDPPDREVMPFPKLNMTAPHTLHSHISASTPDGPHFLDTPNCSFPEASFSPIAEVKNNVSRNDSNLERKLQESCAKNSELEQQITEQKSQIVQLQSHLEEMKKKTDEGASTLKHHVQAIEILVSEKTELQNSLDKKQEEVNLKNGELEELQGRLRASRHRVSDLERELAMARAQVQALENSVSQLTSLRNSLSQQCDSLSKHVGDLELEVSDLQSKLENRDQTIATLQSELGDKTSQLSLAEVRIQQLSGGPGDSAGKVEEELRADYEQLTQTVDSLQNQLATANKTHQEATRDYQRYVERLQHELQAHKAAEEVSNERIQQLTVREQQLVTQVSEMERQLSRVSQSQSTEDPALRQLREQLTQASYHTQDLQSQLAQKNTEVEYLREGLQERALRIQELEATIERLEAERPDSANLQAAIESDKVAASRAVAQNNNLKKQLEELQEALVKLSNSKLELTQQLENEQHLSRDLTIKLEQIQESKQGNVETESCIQTDTPSLQEVEVQTSDSQPVVSPEAMAKLEEKFRKTMDELADLSDEKQRLEHLVMQLQSETETIGEYITLYQIQRGMLRQRAQEKDEQVAKLAQDKEALRNKLAQLNHLVQQLVGAGHHQLNGYDGDPPEGVSSVDCPQALCPQETTEVAKVDTAEQIRSLLTEIGSSNLVTSSGDISTNINFHPCPWCSGRLITV